MKAIIYCQGEYEEGYTGNITRTSGRRAVETCAGTSNEVSSVIKDQASGYES